MLNVPGIFTSDRGDAGRRLDLVLRRHLGGLDAVTRTNVQEWIENGQVAVNGTLVRRPASRAARGDIVTVKVPDTPPRRVMAAENLPVEILYEDEHLLAIDKPAGMVVHPAYRHETGTVMNALLWYARKWPAGQRPSLVGRLDKGTSGVVVVAKTAASHAALQRALSSNQTEKAYLAVVYGRATVRGNIDLRLSYDPVDRRRIVASTTVGTPSVTRFERIARLARPHAELSLLCCRLVTGRRHQIRVHLAARGWPVVGDPVYGEPRWSAVSDPALAAALHTFPRQALHAWRIVLTHPITQTRLHVDAPVPHDLRALLAAAGLSKLALFTDR